MKRPLGYIPHILAVGAITALIVWMAYKPAKAAPPLGDAPLIVINSRSQFCEPCERLKKAWPEIHKRYPNAWVSFSTDNRGSDMVSRYRQGAVHNKTPAVDDEFYPTVHVYVPTEFRGQRGWRERYQMVGYTSADAGLLELMVKQAHQ